MNKLRLEVLLDKVIQTGILKSSFYFIVLMLFFLIPFSVSAADTTPPTIVSSEPEGTITKNTFNLTVQTDEDATCKFDSLNLIYVDMNNTFSTTSTEHYSEMTLSDGDYIFYARCKDAHDNFMTSSEVISFTIDSTGGGDVSAPSIIDHSPVGTISGNTVVLKAITNEESTCKFSETNQDYTTMSNMFSGTIDHTYDLSVSEGSYNYYIRCKDSYNNTMSSSYEIEFSVDNTKPFVMNYTPDLSQTHSFEMEMITNEYCDCKYSSSEAKSYQNMESIFSVTGDTIHRTPLSFDSDGFKRLYVKCKDKAGNIMSSDHIIKIDVDVPPSAQITLSENSPIKPGKVYVTLVASEPLVKMPKLRYKLYHSNGESDYFNIPLQGSDQTWTGYMILSSGGNENIGSFEFEGVDYGGNIGDTITSGNTFIVDSSTPGQIEYIDIFSQSDGTVKIKWEYENDDDIDKYIIYRSLTPGVSLLDYHDETDNKQYIDDDTNPNTVYFYKIAPVDKAGNRGLLSKEVDRKTEVSDDSSTTSSSSSGSSSQSSKDSSSGLKNNLVPLVDDAIKKTEMIDNMIQNSIMYYRGQKDLDENIVKEIGLASQASKSKQKLINYVQELNDLKKRDMSQEQLEQQIRRIEIKIEALKKSFTVRASEKEEIDVVSEANAEDIDSSISNLLNLLRIVDLEPEYRNSLKKESARLQNLFDIDSTAKIIDITYADSTTEQILYITKKITQSRDKQEDELGMMIVEDIPQEIAGSVGEVTFLSDGYDILKSSTVVKWNFEKLTDNTIKYYVKGSFSDLDSLIIKSTILDNYKNHFTLDGKNPKDQNNDSGNFLTGNIIAKSLDSLKDKNKLFGLLIGLLVVGSLATYYFTMDSEGPNIIEKINQKIKERDNKKNENNSRLDLSLSQQSKFNESSNNHVNQNPKQNNGNLSNPANEMTSSSNNANHLFNPNLSNPNVVPQGFTESVPTDNNNNSMPGNISSGPTSIYLLPLKENKKTDLSELKRANDLIDNMSFHQANNIYFSIINSLDLNKYDDSMKKEIRDNLEALHKKLSMYVKVYHANINHSRKETLNLINDLNEISQYYNYIYGRNNNSTQLMSFTKQKYEQLKDYVMNNQMF